MPKKPGYIALSPTNTLVLTYCGFEDCKKMPHACHIYIEATIVVIGGLKFWAGEGERGISVPFVVSSLIWGCLCTVTLNTVRIRMAYI